LVTLIDTAGLRATDDLVEAAGISGSIQRIKAARAVILVLDGSEPNHPDDSMLFELTASGSPLIVISKSDLPSRIDPEVVRARAGGCAVFTLSVVTGEGFSDFIAALTSRFSTASKPANPSLIPLNSRHRNALERAAGHLDAAAGITRSDGEMLDKTALELCAALAALGEITGQAATEEILEHIFSRFCVGK
jgi:tRNA modification GTPase